MPVPTWRARVRGPSGEGVTGAGFLVRRGMLLTCAHVVQGHDEVLVDFPELPAAVGEGLTARVVRPTDWRTQGDDGDVAVLLLDRPPDLEPAPLASPDALARVGVGDPRGLGTFATYGFPNRREPYGRHADVRTGPHMSLRDEWWQLETVSVEQVRKGYSGAAVYDPGTGEVAGMVTEADREIGTAKMLPVTTLRRHVEELNDLLPLTWLSWEARHELRLLLTGVRFTAPLEAEVAEITGRHGAAAFRSAWHSAWYIAEGWPLGRLALYLNALQRYLPEHTAYRLNDWSRRHLRGIASPVPAPVPSAGPASVIVRLDRLTGGDFDLTVHTWIDGAAGPTQPTVRVTKARLREEVQNRVEKASRAVFGLNWMIEFAVPEGMLHTAFEDWYVDPVNRIPMSMYPVVVRDVARLWPSIRRDLVHRRWQVLLERGRTDPQPVGCDQPRTGRSLQRWLMANTGHCVLVYGTRPAKGWLTAALNTGVPVMLWPRTKCDDPSHDGCRKVSAALTAAVSGHAPHELPEVAARLRGEALNAPLDEPHCGRDLTLLWDDPSRLPDPPLAMPES